MSFFGKLFGKNESTETPQQPERKKIDTPWGKLTLCDSFEYEGTVDWYDDGSTETGISIDCDIYGADDITRGYEKFVYIMEHKADIDYQVKMTALEHFADNAGLVMSHKNKMPMSKELFLDTMPIEHIMIMRDGSIDFFMEHNDILNSEGECILDISVIYTDKGTFEIKTDQYY